MAIIPDVPNVVVDIVVDETPLPEYLDEDDDESVTPNSTTKYVECKSGTSFAIRIDLTGLKRVKGANSVIARYFIDGQRITGSVLRPPWTNGRGVSLRNTHRYEEGGSWKERDLVFADLVISASWRVCSVESITDARIAEQGTSGKPKPELRDLGMITIKLYHAKAGRSHLAKHSNFSDLNVGQEKLHEKDVKGQAISSQIKYANPSIVDARQLTHTGWEKQDQLTDPNLPRPRALEMLLRHSTSGTVRAVSSSTQIH